MNRLHDQIYRDRGRWEELNHLIVDSVKDRPVSTAGQVSEDLPWQSFIRSMGVEPNAPIDPKLVFVLTPLNAEEQSSYETVRNVCQDVGLQVRRGDEVKIVGPILPHIIREILTSFLVIANVNGRNPNVFYELGMAQAMGKTCILIARNAEIVPFDLSSQQLVIYKDESDLRDKLGQALSRVAFGGHVPAVVRTFYSKPLDQEAMVVLTSPDDVERALTLLRNMADISNASVAFGSTAVFVRGKSASKQFITDITDFLKQNGVKTKSAMLVSDPLKE